MKLRVVSIHTYGRKRELSKLGKENEGKMCITKQKNGGAERIPSTFTCPREEHCRG